MLFKGGLRTDPPDFWPDLGVHPLEVLRGVLNAEGIAFCWFRLELELRCFIDGLPRSFDVERPLTPTPLIVFGLGSRLLDCWGRRDEEGRGLKLGGSAISLPP